MTDRETSSWLTRVYRYASVQNNTEDDPSAVVDWSRAKNEYTYWIGAISEAVFLLGAERNSDKIFGSSFAPLLQNLNSFQWTVRVAGLHRCPPPSGKLPGISAN